MASYPFTARAILKYKSPPGSSTPFSFAKGDELSVVGLAGDDDDDEDDDWVKGRLSDGTEGVFPASFVQKIESSPPAQASAPAPAEAQTEHRVEGPTSAISAPVQAQSSGPNTTSSTHTSSRVEQPVATPAVAKAASPPSVSGVTPDAPAKPQSLKDRIAALNAAGAGAAAPPPPMPRAKPAAFKRPAVTAPAAERSSESAPATSPTTGTSSANPLSPVPIDASSSSGDVERGSTSNPAFSAEDAKASIGAGGSLKERMARLQAMSLDTPPEPGRAPKPWKKKSVEVPAAEKDNVEADGHVKDELPGVEDKTCESEDAAPGFEPATPDEEKTESAAQAPVSNQEVGGMCVAQPLQDDDELDPEHEKKDFGHALPTAPQAGDESAAELAEEDEATKRAAIAARMAGLGGQRMGMAMPALPKRAGPPRRRGAGAGAAATTAAPASTPAEASAVESSVPGQSSVSDVPPSSNELASGYEEDIEDAAATPQDESSSNVLGLGTAASAGAGLVGGGSLASTLGKDKDLVSAAAEDDDDDFDTPALPETSSPILSPVSSVLAEPEQPIALDKVSPEEEEALIADDEAEAGEDPADAETFAPVSVAKPPGRPAAPPPPPPAQPPYPGSDAEQDEDDGFEGPSSRAGIVPAPLNVDPEIVDPGVTEVSPPTSPVSTGRPPIPVVPMSFAAPSPPLEKKSIEIPRGEPEVFESIAPTRSSDAEQQEQGPPPIPAGRPPVPDAGRPAKLPVPMPAHEASDVRDDDETQAVPPPMPRTTLPPPPPTVEPSASATVDDGTAEEASAVRSEPIADTQTADDFEDEDEDPEIARRRAIAARMAKLGGVNMRMPMFGAMPPPKPAKKKSVPVPEEEQASSPVEASGEEEAPPVPAPSRRIPGVPTGGVALPGIVPKRAPEPEPEVARDQPEQLTAEDEEDRGMTADEQAAADLAEEDQAPPPLPAGRPPTVPAAQSSREIESQGDGDAAPPLPIGRPPQPTVANAFVDEPEQHDREEYEDDAGVAASSPPPRRPSSGLPPLPTSASSAGASLPLSEQQDDPPGSPPTRKTSIFGRKSMTSERGLGRTSIDSSREQYLAGGAVQRTESVQSSISAGQGRMSMEQGVSAPVHPQQEQQYSPQELAQFSSTLGAQIFAAAHSKLADKNSRERDGDALVDFCFSRATNPLPRQNYGFGAPVLDVEGNAKAKTPTIRVQQDEPRAGDIVVFFDTKFKHNLSTTKVGSDKPMACVLAAFDAQKRKLRTIEVGKSGQIEEGAHRLDDLKSGNVVVFRALPAGEQY